MQEDAFEAERKKAIERMREMDRRRSLEGQLPHNMPPSPAFVRVNTPPPEKANEEHTPPFENACNTPPTRSAFDLSGFLKGLDIPFLSKIGDGADSSLIAILLLLLWSDRGDKLLLAALAYILL